MTNCINGLKNAISSQKSGEMAFFLEKQIITQNLVKGEDAVYTMTIKITDKKLVALKSRKNV
mgnify:CR=1 FL=1